jgi:hypothetical protein
MVRTRRRNFAAPVPPPICDHCGRTGHISDLCDRTSYDRDFPGISCRNCLRRISSCTADDGPHQVLVKIITCAAHSTRTNRPAPAVQTPPVPAAPALRRPAAPALQPPPPPRQAAPALQSPPSSPPPPYAGPARQLLPAAVHAPVAPAVNGPPQPPPAAGPVRRTKQLSLGPIRSRYDVVLQHTKTGRGLYEALRLCSINRNYWRGIRPIAEALLVDRNSFLETLGRLGPLLSQKTAATRAALLLNSAAGKTRLAALHLEGSACKPLENY